MKSKKVLAGIASLAMLASLTGCGTPSLKKAYDACNGYAKDKESLEVSEDGSSLKGYYLVWSNDKLIDCVAEKTNMSDAVKDRIKNVVLEYEDNGERDWDGLHAEWIAIYSGQTTKDTMLVKLTIETTK